MKRISLRALKTQTGVRLLRFVMLLVLIVVTAVETRAEDVVFTCPRCGHVGTYSEGIGYNKYQYTSDNDCSVIFKCASPSCGSVIYNKVHQFDGEYTVVATCTEPGGKVKKCKRCGVIEYTEVSQPALGHDLSGWTTVAATCTTGGYEHNYCRREGCGYEETRNQTPALGHDMSGWITVAATCTTGGYEHNYCRRDGCNYEERRNETPALGHDFALDHNCTRCDAVDPAKQPTGHLDNCAGGELQISLYGWAYDPNAPATSIDMHVYVYQNDGTTRYGDIHIIHADLERPDLATALSIPTNHGYSTTIPIADAGTYKVKVYAIDLNGDGNPQIGATQSVTVGVPYIAANGQAQICNSATRLTGGEATTLSSGWYYVTGEVNYTGCLTLDGDANIILCDGATLNIGSSESRLTTHCILGQDYTLTVYGQGQQTGALYGYNKTSNKPLNPNSYYNPRTARVSQFTQYGGNVTFDLNVHSSIVSSPYPVEANVDFRGGHFTANGGYGIKGNVNINWNDPDDRFRTSGFGPNGTGDTVTIAGGKAFTDGTNYYASTLDNTAKVGAQGRTLWPVTAISLADNIDNSTLIGDIDGLFANVTLSGRTLYKDGAWNTLCLPFNLTAREIAESPLAGADIRTLSSASFDEENRVLTLNFTPAVGNDPDNPAWGSITSIEPGVPYIIRWEKANDYVDDDEHNIVNPTFQKVTLCNDMYPVVVDDVIMFQGGYAPISFTEADKSILFLGAENTLYYPMPGARINACRAYFQLSSGAAVKEFKLNFGEEDPTSLSEELRVKNEESANAVYDLSGRKINSQFSIFNSQLPKGIYIYNGKKILK